MDSEAKDNTDFHGNNIFFFKKCITAKDIITITANPSVPGTFVV